MNCLRMGLRKHHIAMKGSPVTCVLSWITRAMHDDAIKWKHFPRYWPFIWRIHRSPVNSPHKGQWRGALIFFFDLRLNKRLSKQSSGWWFETPSRSLRRHCNGLCQLKKMLHIYWYTISIISRYLANTLIKWPFWYKDTSYQCMNSCVNSHYKVMIVSQLSYSHIGNAIPGKMVVKLKLDGVMSTWDSFTAFTVSHRIIWIK